MKKTLEKTLDLLFSINKKHKLKIPLNDFKSTNDSFESESKIENSLDLCIKKMKKSISEKNLNLLIMTTFDFNLLLSSLSTDLSNTSELILKTSRKMPSYEFKTYKPKQDMNFPNNISSLINQGFITKRKDQQIDSYKNAYRLNKTFSPLIRKDDFLININDTYKLYGEGYRTVKLAFNEDGTCNLKATRETHDREIVFRYRANRDI